LVYPNLELIKEKSLLSENNIQNEDKDKKIDVVAESSVEKINNNSQVKV
jgi:hypothetical protein